VFSAWFVQSGYKEELVEIWDASLPGYELGSGGIKLSWQLHNNGKKGIRLWKENFMCDLMWQWDSYISVARIRLVKTEDPSACVTVNCKVSRSAIALWLSVVPSCVYKLSINPIILFMCVTCLIVWGDSLNSLRN
jgi:hypothetical protein